MQGFVFFRGPSEIDGNPIVGIATGLMNGGFNTKTGNMVQTYIMRSDINPVKAVHTGDDYSVCAGCRHRGSIVPDGDATRNVGRSCYVTLFHGPRVVFNAFQRGVYADVEPVRARNLLARRSVRVGSYGDPGAIPSSVWQTILSKVKFLSGYTHLWERRPELAEFCMASCDSEEERSRAKALGFRTFRVRSPDDPKLSGEGHCPASHEMNKAIQCADCLLCGGTRCGGKADITIIAHGVGASNFTRQNMAS